LSKRKGLSISFEESLVLSLDQYEHITRESVILACEEHTDAVKGILQKNGDNDFWNI
jgi:hypothetical protein